jgi:hypothetical protein
MQTREQIKNWKVVASLASVAALGISGLAIASTGDQSETPPPIEIDDRRDLGQVVFPPTTQPGFEIVPGPSFTLDGDASLDSPLASADLDDSVDDSIDDSPDTTIAPTTDSVDSVDDSPDTTIAPTTHSVDSVDSPDDSGDSGDSMDSLDS